MLVIVFVFWNLLLDCFIRILKVKGLLFGWVMMLFLMVKFVDIKRFIVLVILVWLCLELLEMGRV